MREIKFRAWDPLGEKMYSVAFQGWNGNVIAWKDNKPQTTEVILPPVAEGVPILMQYTGVLDKRSVKIYEGDIVKKDFNIIRNGENLYRIGEVVWGAYSDEEYVDNIECFMLKDYLPLSDLGGLHGASSHTNEVIGNIYENPELLEKK